MEKNNKFVSYFYETKAEQEAKKEPKYVLNVSYKDLLKIKDEYNRFVLDDVVSKKNTHIKNLTTTSADPQKLWVKGNDFDLLLKQINQYSYMEYGPQIYYELARQMGLDALKYDVALIDDKKILFSKSYLKDNEISISGTELGDYFVKTETKKSKYFSNKENNHNCLEMVPTLVKSLNKDVSNAQIAKIMGNLYSMHLLDLMTHMSDRHAKNWSVIFDLNNNARLAPVYDNDFVFYLQRHRFNINFDFDKVPNPSLHDLKFTFHLCFEHSKDAQEDLVKFSEKHLNKDTIEQIKNIVNKTNIEEAFKNIETENNKEIPSIVKKSAKKTFNTNKKSVVKCLDVAIKNLDNLDKKRTR